MLGVGNPRSMALFLPAEYEATGPGHTIMSKVFTALVLAFLTLTLISCSFRYALCSLIVIHSLSGTALI
jgi:hypothetical protein